MAKVLLVEDELQWVILEEEALKQAGHEVVWTTASSTAWEYLETARKEDDPFHLAVIDLVEIPQRKDGPLVKREGEKLVKRLRASPHYRTLPVICTTVWLQPDSRKPPWKTVAREAGADEFFEQPVDSAQLTAAVERLLGTYGVRGGKHGSAT